VFSTILFKTLKARGSKAQGGGGEATATLGSDKTIHKALL